MLPKAWVFVWNLYLGHGFVSLRWFVLTCLGHSPSGRAKKEECGTLALVNGDQKRAKINWCGKRCKLLPLVSFDFEKGPPIYTLFPLCIVY